MSNRAIMDRTDKGRRPSFFWQGLMILLPVAVLAVVGLYSLRQDEQAAEQAARKRAADDAQNLARAMSDMAGEDLMQFLDLQNVWMIDLNAESQPSTTTSMPPDKDLEAGIAKWERAHPGLRLAALVEPECDLLTDGPRDRAATRCGHPFAAKMVLRTFPQTTGTLGRAPQEPKGGAGFPGHESV